MTKSQEESCTSELYQGHLGRNLIDPSLQDSVVVPEGFLQAH